jgi:hypothetical protein
MPDHPRTHATPLYRPRMLLRQSLYHGDRKGKLEWPYHHSNVSKYYIFFIYLPEFRFDHPAFGKRSVRIKRKLCRRFYGCPGEINSVF